MLMWWTRVTALQNYKRERGKVILARACNNQAVLIKCESHWNRWKFSDIIFGTVKIEMISGPWNRDHVGMQYAVAQQTS